MLPSDLTLTRYKDRWLVRVGRSLVEVCDTSVTRSEAQRVAERMRDAGLLGDRGHEKNRNKGMGGSLPDSTAPSPRTCSCLDCLSCELRSMRERTVRT